MLSPVFGTAVGWKMMALREASYFQSDGSTVRPWTRTAIWEVPSGVAERGKSACGSPARPMSRSRKGW